ncbi:hypothetical protein MTQ01_03965 [Streptomyces sp. XM4193]|uniref:hypothetical protein n=1 Tax=Streptomyces sp. XM4193 TaxID=2929782 RepID=UPI001FFBCFE1|nr:hypothetical protein [Streptomyces sp. XM4193]MCK1795177.1 hypothetical protein [Streptomyces sp. XM4193]
MGPLTTLTFERRLDGLRYRFTRNGEHHGRPAHLRTDGQVLCVWSPADGWHCALPDGTVVAKPLETTGDEAQPPATVWRSFKNGKSYLYDVLRGDPSERSEEAGEG